MYLVDFSYRPVTTRRWLGCPCYGVAQGCTACSGTGRYPIDMTLDGVLLSDSLRDEVMACLRLVQPSDTRLIWGQRLLTAVRMLRSWHTVPAGSSLCPIDEEFGVLVEALIGLAQRSIQLEMPLVISEVVPE